MKTLIFGGGGIASALTGEVTYGDVRDIGLVDEIMEMHKPDIVINCAGVSYAGPIRHKYYEREIEINLIGSFNIAQACVWNNVKTMIFIASVAGLYGKPNHAAYCASKAGVISLVQSLAMEGYDAYAISPGRVNTPMRERDYPNDTPGSRLEPSDIAGVVQEILDGKFDPGDNIIIRKEGLTKIIREVDKGEPWREKLKVGQPVTI